MQNINKRLKLKFEQYIQLVILFLMVFIPFRNLLEIVCGMYIKVLADVLVLSVVMLFLVLYVKNIKLKLYDVFLGAFLLLAFFNTVIIHHVSMKVYLFQVRSIILYYMLFFVIRHFELPENFIKRVCSTLRYITYILFFLGIIEKIGRKEWLFPAEIAESILYEDNFVRVYSMFFNPNTYGAFVVLAFIIVLFYENKKLFLYKSIVVASLLMSMSRSAMLLFVMFLLTYAFFVKRKQIRDNIGYYLFQCVLIFFLGMIIYMASEYFTIQLNASNSIVEEENSQEKVTEENFEIMLDTNEEITAQQSNDNEAEKSIEVQNDNQTTVFTRMEELNSDDIITKSMTDGRLHYLLKGIEIFKNHPILGTGFGTYGSAASLNWNPPIYEKYNLTYGFYSDNEYIKELVETGVLGVGLLCAFFFLIFFENKSNKIIVLLLLSLSWLGLFYNVLEVQIVAFLFWLMLGLNVCGCKKILKDNN